MTLTFDLQTWVLSATLRLIKVNISTRLFENPSITNKVMLRTSNSQYWKCDLNLWPWPLADQHGSCAQHTVRACLTFLPRDLKIHAYRTKLCSDKHPFTKGQNLTFWPWIVTLTFDLGTWFLWMALPLIEVNTSAKLFENPLIKDRDMLRTSKIWPFDLELWPWPLT